MASKKQKSLGQICAAAFEESRQQGYTYPCCYDRAAAAVEREVLKRLKTSFKKQLGIKPLAKKGER